ncbi:hypothetical protein V1478_002748 [Vespula squamosa]|uniref:Uncharacterized protein n=1 Tax=Vespula squamosa TaxID=30214 RepID=A0ABD2BT04_VESSQ
MNSGRNENSVNSIRNSVVGLNYPVKSDNYNKTEHLREFLAHFEIKDAIRDAIWKKFQRTNGNFMGFSNRRQRTGEDLAMLTKCTAVILSTIASTQFINTIRNPLLLRTLQLEEVKSLKKTATRAIEIEEKLRKNVLYFFQDQVVPSRNEQVGQFSKIGDLHRERMKQRNIAINFSRNHQEQNINDKKKQPRNVGEC